MQQRGPFKLSPWPQSSGHALSETWLLKGNDFGKVAHRLCWPCSQVLRHETELTEINRRIHTETLGRWLAHGWHMAGTWQLAPGRKGLRGLRGLRGLSLRLHENHGACGTWAASAASAASASTANGDGTRIWNEPWKRPKCRPPCVVLHVLHVVFCGDETSWPFTHVAHARSVAGGPAILGCCSLALKCSWEPKK